MNKFKLIKINKFKKTHVVYARIKQDEFDQLVKMAKDSNMKVGMIIKQMIHHCLNNSED